MDIYRLPIDRLMKKMEKMSGIRKESILIVRRRMQRKYGKFNSREISDLEQYISKPSAKLDFGQQLMKVICIQGARFDM